MLLAAYVGMAVCSTRVVEAATPPQRLLWILEDSTLTQMERERLVRLVVLYLDPMDVVPVLTSDWPTPFDHVSDVSTLVQQVDAAFVVFMKVEPARVLVRVTTAAQEGDEASFAVRMPMVANNESFRVLALKLRTVLITFAWVAPALPERVEPREPASPVRAEDVVAPSVSMSVASPVRGFVEAGALVAMREHAPTALVQGAAMAGISGADVSVALAATQGPRFRRLLEEGEVVGGRLRIALPVGERLWAGSAPGSPELWAEVGPGVERLWLSGHRAPGAVQASRTTWLFVASVRAGLVWPLHDVWRCMVRFGVDFFPTRADIYLHERRAFTTGWFEATTELSVRRLF